jgi:integrase
LRRDDPYGLEALYVLAVHTGLRRSEILGLRWTDVDLDIGTLSVQRSLGTDGTGLAHKLRATTRNSGLFSMKLPPLVTNPDFLCKADGTFNPPKRNKSRRTVKLTGQAAEVLKSHRTRQNEERLRLGSLWQDHGLVFSNRLGKPMNADNIYHREFRPLLKKGELSGFTFHSLRHTCATLLLSKNVNPKIVQEMLGHATISRTMDTYSHVTPGMGDVAATALEEALS